MKRAILLSLADLATTYLVATLGFWLLGEGRTLWIVVGAGCAGTWTRMLMDAALTRTKAQRTFVLETLRQRGELTGRSLWALSDGLLPRASYVLLMRMEDEGLIASRPDPDKGALSRRLYRIAPQEGGAS
jgi:hypothetical protein